MGGGHAESQALLTFLERHHGCHILEATVEETALLLSLTVPVPTILFWLKSDAAYIVLGKLPLSLHLVEKSIR